MNIFWYDSQKGMKNIQELLQKSKGLLAEGISNWGLIIIILLTGLGSFGLGRLSALETARPPVALQMAPEASKPQEMYMGGLLVAARSGGVYYYPWCISDVKISPSNQLWFKDEATAQRAGYRPAKNCKGLTLP